MTTQTKPKPADSNLLEDLAERARELNEQIIETSREAGVAYLDAYEKTLRTIVDSQRDLTATTDGTPVEFLTTLLSAQSQLTQDVAKSVTSYYRELLK
jgi:hypothetical protein